MAQVIAMSSAPRARAPKPQPKRIKALMIRLGKTQRKFDASSFAFQMNEVGQITALFLSDLPQGEFTRLFRAGMYQEHTTHVLDCIDRCIELKAILEEEPK